MISKSPDFRTTSRRRQFFVELWDDVKALQKIAGQNVTVDVRPDGTIINAFAQPGTGQQGGGGGGPPPPQPPPSTHCYNVFVTAVFSGAGEMIATSGNFNGLDFGPLRLGGDLSGSWLHNILNTLPGTIGVSGSGPTLEYVASDLFFTDVVGQVSVTLNWTGSSWTVTVGASAGEDASLFPFGVGFASQTLSGISLPGSFSFSLTNGIGAWFTPYGEFQETSNNQYNCVGTITITFC